MNNSRENIIRELAFLKGNDAFTLHEMAKILNENNYVVIGERLENIARNIDKRVENIQNELGKVDDYFSKEAPRCATCYRERYSIDVDDCLNRTGYGPNGTCTNYVPISVTIRGCSVCPGKNDKPTHCPMMCDGV